MGKLTKLEQETIITYNEQEQQAEVYTHNKGLQKRLSGFCEKHPEQFFIKADNGAGGLTFIVPKKRITVTAPRTLTPEQREKARQNLNR